MITFKNANKWLFSIFSKSSFLQSLDLIILSFLIIGSAFVLFVIGVPMLNEYIVDNIPKCLKESIFFSYSLLITFFLIYYFFCIKYLLVDAISKSSFPVLNFFTMICNLATPMSLTLLLLYTINIDDPSELDIFNGNMIEFLILFLFIYFPMAQYQINKISYEYNLLELNKIAKLEERIDTLSVTKKDTFWTLLITMFNHFSKKK